MQYSHSIPIFGCPQCQNLTKTKFNLRRRKTFTEAEQEAASGKHVSLKKGHGPCVTDYPKVNHQGFPFKKTPNLTV